MVQETVSNQVMGKMRFQFWRDALTGIAEVRQCPSSKCIRIDAFMTGFF